MITVVGNLKGGTGKSTIAFNLSVKLSINSQKVQLFDLDPQATLSDVIDIRLEEEYEPKISAEKVFDILGPGHSKDKYQGNDVAGVVTGLAWTSVGGDILFIETSLSKGKGTFTLTGNLGDVMKESAMTALSYLKANAEELGIDYRVFQNYDLHIHTT